MRMGGDLVVLGALALLAAGLLAAAARRVRRGWQAGLRDLPWAAAGVALLVLAASATVAWRIAEAHAPASLSGRSPLGVWVLPAQVVLGGLIAGLLAAYIVDDITGTRRRLRRRLDEQQRRLDETESSFRAIVEASPVGIFVVDPSEYGILEASLTGAGLLGWPRAELAGRRLDEFLAPGAGSVDEIVQKARNPQVPSDRFTRFRRRDGRPFEVELSVTPIVFHGGPALVITAHDVSSLELARRAAEAASLAKNRFLVQLGHEVRTPLNAILGAVSMARAEPGSGETLRDSLETIGTAAQSLLLEVEQALDLSRMTLGDPTVDVAPFELRRVVSDAVSQLAPRARARRRLLVDTVRADLASIWVGDAKRLEALLLALVGRAILLGHDDEIAVCCQPGPSLGADGPSLEIVVSGLPRPESAERTATSAGPSGMSFGDGGSSLGLMLARELVASLGGLWDERVDPDGRPLLAIALPFRPGGDPREPRANDPLLAGRSVLVVHRSAAVRASLVESLLTLGVRGAGVPDLAAAGQRARRTATEGTPFDAALVDVALLEEESEEVDALRADLGEHAPVAAIAPAPRARWPRPARFGVALPATLQEIERALVRALESVPSDEDSSGGRAVRGCVLVVEDSAINRRLVADMLERAGLSVLTAADGAEALEIVAAEQVQLVLMDIEMPRLDGVETTRRLRADPRHGSLPILALTARVGSEERHACFDAGFDGFLAKPVDHDTLITTVFTWLRGDAESLRRDLQPSSASST
ncbi:MAG: hypothetical protein Kow0062_12840 [Acidobacteriota bacterium]